MNKLAGPYNYLEWKRYITAFMRLTDHELLGLQPEPENESDAWKEAQIKAKCNIMLALGTRPMYKAGSIIDDTTETAHDLWNFLADWFENSKEQVVQTIQRQIKNMKYSDGEEWDEHEERFDLLVLKLGLYDHPISDKEKIWRLIQTLPPSFSSLHLKAPLFNADFFVFTNDLRTEIDRREQNDSKRRNTGNYH